MGARALWAYVAHRSGVKLRCEAMTNRRLRDTIWSSSDWLRMAFRGRFAAIQSRTWKILDFTCLSALGQIVVPTLLGRTSAER